VWCGGVARSRVRLLAAFAALSGVALRSKNAKKSSSSKSLVGVIVGLVVVVVVASEELLVVWCGGCACSSVRLLAAFAALLGVS